MSSSAMPELVLEIAEQVDDGGLHRDVERGDRLVGDDQFRLAGECAGERDALALAAGELVRHAAQDVGRQPHALQQADGFGLRLGTAEAAQQAQRAQHGVLDGMARVQRRIRVLEHHLDAAFQVDRAAVDAGAGEVLPGRAWPRRRSPR